MIGRLHWQAHPQAKAKAKRMGKELYVKVCADLIKFQEAWGPSYA